MMEDAKGERGEGLGGWVRRHPKLTAVFCLFLLLLMGTLLFDRAAGNRLQHELDAIKARGEPISVQDINEAMIDLPVEKNPAFTVLYRAEFLQRTCKVPEDIDKHLPEIGSAKPEITGVPLPAEQIEALRWYFDSRVNDVYLLADPTDSTTEGKSKDATLANAVEEIEAVLAQPGGRYQVTIITPAISVLLPELSKYRQVAQLLEASCSLDAEMGDMSACAKDLDGLYRLARLFDGGYQFLISALVKFSIEAQHLLWIERVINRIGLDAADLKKIQEQIELIQVSPDLQRAMMSERVMFIDTYQWARSGTGGGIAALSGLTTGGTGVGVPLNLWQYIPALPSLDATYGLGMYAELVEATQEPGPQSLNRAKQAGFKAMLAPAYHFYSRIMLPSLSRSVELWLRGVGTKRAMIAALASERYRLANGKWPESLTGLVPKYLKAVPVDPFDDAPIRYAVTTEGINVWCIGEDLKDDGGNTKRREKQTASNQPTDWGWVILNPDLRGKPMPQPANADSSGSPATQSDQN